MGYWKIAVAIFPSEVWKLPHLSPQTSNTEKYYKLTKPIRENIASSWSQYEKILPSRGPLLEVIENNCIVTRDGVYNEISPEPSGNPSGSGNISLYTPPLVTIQLQYHNIAYYTLPSLTIKYHTTLYHTIPYHTILCYITWSILKKMFNSSS